jgi:hypothetical protein
MTRNYREREREREREIERERELYMGHLGLREALHDNV